MDARPSFQKKRKIREDRKPACDTCRAHKLRCDASLDYSRPCSRCLKKKIACVVQEQRRKKTSSNGSLNTQSISPNHDTLPLSESSLTNASNSMPIPQRSASSIIQPISIIAEKGVLEPLTSAPMDGFSGTESRAISSVHVEAATIDICFARFNRYCVPLIPILSAKLSPNETMRESPLKFWVIVAIGSRKCLEDPTLYSTLSPHVETLAMTSLCPGRTSPYPIIEAFLLMGSFHLSTDRPFWRNIYCSLSNAVVMLTLQAGMHHCLGLQGVFALTGNPEIERATKLWAYAAITNQKNMAIHGYPINDPLITRHLVWGYDCCETLPGWLALQGRIMAIVAKFNSMIPTLELEEGLKFHSKMLKSLISASEAELLDLHGGVSLEDQGPLSRFDFAIARLQIRSFVLLTNQSDIDCIDRSQLSNAAISAIEAVNELEDEFQISLICPDYVLQGIQLAACTLLKLLKSYPPRTSVCDKDQTNALFSAINISKSISVVNNDVPAKISEILANLWSSQSVYRDADGEYVHSLQVRNRLTMSVVYDCLWWWRKLFLSAPNPQPTQGQYINGYNLSSLSQAVGDSSSSNPLLFDDWDGWGLDWDVFGSSDVPA